MSENKWMLITFDSMETMTDFLKVVAPNTVKEHPGAFGIRVSTHFPYDDDSIHIKHHMKQDHHHLEITLKKKKDEKNR